MNTPVRYLIVADTFTPFYTNYYDEENHWKDGINMKVFDLHTDKYCEDGETWKDIDEDHL